VPHPPEDAAVEDWHALYFMAFEHLIHDRQYAGMAGVPMPLTRQTIANWAVEHGVAAADVDEFAQLVRALDDEWLKVARKDKG